MKKWGILVVLLCCGIMVNAAKVALIPAAPELSTVADQVLAVMSKDSGIEFLERAEIDKILSEHKLHATGLSRTTLAKQFPHVDLIAIITPSDVVSFNARNGFLLVNHPHQKEIPQIIEQIKIAQGKMRDSKPILLSIVAMRDGGISSTSLQQIPVWMLALERELIAAPKIQMLERDYLKPVLDERKLSDEFNQLAPSAKLIRLEFSFGETNTAIDLTFRLSDIQGKILFKETIRDCFADSSNKLKLLVAKLQEFLKASSPQVAVESTKPEAKSYFEEYQRLLSLRNPQQAEQKLVAAMALDQNNFFYHETYLTFRREKLLNRTSDLCASARNQREELEAAQNRSDKLIIDKCQKELNFLLKSISQNHQEILTLCEEALTLCQKKTQAFPEKQDTFLFLHDFILNLAILRRQHNEIYDISGLKKTEIIAPFSPAQQDWLNRALPLYFEEMYKHYNGARIHPDFNSNKYLFGLLVDAEIVTNAIIQIVKIQKAYVERHSDQLNPNSNIAEYLWLPLASFEPVNDKILSKFPQELIDDIQKSSLKILQNYGYIMDILKSVSIHKHDKKLVVAKYRQFLQASKNSKNFELSNYRIPIRDFIGRLAPEYNQLLCKVDAEIFPISTPEAVSQHKIWTRELERLPEGTDAYAKKVIALAPQMVKAANDEKTRALLDGIQRSALIHYINYGRQIQKQAFEAVQYDGISIELPFLLRNVESDSRIVASAADQNIIYFLVSIGRELHLLHLMKYDATQNNTPKLIHKFSMTPPWHNMVLKIEGKFMLLSIGDELTILNYPEMTLRSVIKNLPQIQALAILNNRVYVIGGNKEIIMLSSDLDGNNRHIEFSNKKEDALLEIEKLGIWRCKVLCADPDNHRLIFNIYLNTQQKAQGIYEYLPDKQLANQLTSDTRMAAFGNNILLIGHQKIDLFNPQNNQIEPTGLELLIQKAQTIGWNCTFDSVYFYPKSLVLVKMDCLIKLSKKN